MIEPWNISRRTFLRGAGAAVALPMLEAMMPASARAVASRSIRASKPQRLAFVYIPNGANMQDWTPQATGAEYEMPMILEPLQSLRSEFQVVSGLALDKARPNGDGAGDHARASASFLTGCQARKTSGADIKVGVSVDQIVAEQIGHTTRLPSLELSCDRGQQAGNCDSGYSCAYQFNLAWKTESTPLPPEVDPRLVFERLFGGGSAAEREENRIRRNIEHKSILDFVLGDAARLKAKLGATDRRKMDEYLSSVREMERRIEQSEKFSQTYPTTNYPKPDEFPDNYESHLRLMYDLLALAFQTDSTRVATFIVAHDGSNRTYDFIDVPSGHHNLSHHGNDAEKMKQIAKINQFHMKQFAYFLEKLKSMKEGDGALLDNCMVVYGSGIGDGNRHNHDNLPIVLAGRGGGTLNPGRHLKLERETPITNLYLSLLDRAGVAAERLGDSTGRLDTI